MLPFRAGSSELRACSQVLLEIKDKIGTLFPDNGVSHKQTSPFVRRAPFKSSWDLPVPRALSCKLTAGRDLELGLELFLGHLGLVRPERLD